MLKGIIFIETPNTVTFTGSTDVTGIEFCGHAGGTIRGSIINYASTQMTLSGDSDLYFNRSGLSDLPAGFTPELILYYDSSSYAEIVL